MEKQYKLSSVNWAVFRDGKVIPFVFNDDKSRIRVFGKKIDVEYTIDNIEKTSELECAYRKLESLRRCACLRKFDKSNLSANSLATKEEILDIAKAYEVVLKRNIKLNVLNDSVDAADKNSRDF